MNYIKLKIQDFLNESSKLKSKPIYHFTE